MVIVAFVGLPGTGKTTATGILARKGYVGLRFGDITDDVVRERHLSLTEENERLVREDLRKELGMDAYARLNLPKIQALVSRNKSVAIDGMRSYEELLYLKKHLPGFTVVHVYTPKELRYARTAGRQLRPLTREEMESRDLSEINNLNVGKTIAAADITIDNTAAIAELEQNLEKQLHLNHR